MINREKAGFSADSTSISAPEVPYHHTKITGIFLEMIVSNWNSSPDSVLFVDDVDFKNHPDSYYKSEETKATASTIKLIYAPSSNLW